MNGYRVGMKVVFGRRNGEKTQGIIVKMNPTKAKVQIAEDRGVKSKAGEVWTVPYSLMIPAEGESLTVVEQPKLKWSFFQPRDEVAILDAILTIYSCLSPENLSADGERPYSQVVALRSKYQRQLRGLFTAFGREVSESEVFDWSQQRAADKVRVRENANG